MFFLLELIPGLDLSAFHEFYSKDLRGPPPFSVALMTTLLVDSYSVGVFSRRKIALACERNLAFLAIVGNDRPDFRPVFQKVMRQRLPQEPAGGEEAAVLGGLARGG